MTGPARVTLTLWTGRGERVGTLIAGAPLAQGLHQEVVWDGRTGDQHPVANGAYLAEIAVAYDDGTKDRILRKVAVVRSVSCVRSRRP